VSLNVGWNGESENHILVFPACIQENQFAVTKEVVIPRIVNDQRVLPRETTNDSDVEGYEGQGRSYPDATTGT
jgi:hypothetical protein